MCIIELGNLSQNCQSNTFNSVLFSVLLNNGICDGAAAYTEENGPWQCLNAYGLGNQTKEKEPIVINYSISSNFKKIHI